MKMAKNQMTNPYTNFAAIRDKPLTVFVAMNLLGGFADYIELEHWCNYSRPTIRKAMRPLFQLSLIKPVSQSRFMVTDHAKQLILFDEKFFQLDSSSIINEHIDILSIESTTSKCKSFSALPEIIVYLKSKGVWEESIPDIAELAENSIAFLKAHFEGVDTALAVHRIKKGTPAENKVCPECGELSCGCKYVTGEFSEYIEQ